MTVIATTERISTTPDLFAPELSMATADFEHARKLCEQEFDYRRREIGFDRIVVDEDFHVSIGDDTYALTEKAFDDICGILAVPRRFALEITRELFTIIVDRIGRLHQQTVVLVVRDGVIVGIVDPAKWSGGTVTARPHYLPVTNTELLSVTQKIWKPRGIQPRITIADAGLAVEVLDPSFTVEPQVGDVVTVGVIVTGSETGGPAPVARGYTLRLACANGATAPMSFGNARFNTDWRVRPERRLAAFERAVSDFSLDMERVREAYQGVVDGELTDDLFWRLHRQATYALRRSPGVDRSVDAMFGVQPAQRKQLVAAVRERQGVFRRDRNPTVLSPRPSGIRAWDVYNGITGAARDESVYNRRVALERLGGDLLHEFAPRRAA